MLQWMGGSRRKVTTTRKSTQKRQKQYFEQKRRQQQLSGLVEGYSGGAGVTELRQNPREHRSLDVISLANLSTVSQQPKPDCFSPVDGRGDSTHGSEIDYPIAKEPIVVASAVSTADAIQLEEGTTSGYRVETASSNKMSHSPKNNGNASSGITDKAKLSKAVTEQQFSLFDLLDYGEPNKHLEGRDMCETHVAFSVQGLGKIRAETPPLSPPQPDRSASYGCSAPLKLRRQSSSTNTLSCELNEFGIEVDAMMHDFEIPFRNSMEFANEKKDPYGKWKQNLPIMEDQIKIHGHHSKIRSSLGNRKTVGATSAEDLFDDCGLFDANCIDGRKSDMLWKDEPFRTDDKSADFMKYEIDEMPDYSFGGSHLLERRFASETTERFNILELPASKQQISEDDYDFNMEDKSRHYSLGMDFDFNNGTCKPKWPLFMTEDARDNLSSLSEESSSSTAVRHGANRNSLPKSKSGHCGRLQNTFGRPRAKDGVKNIFAKGWHEDNGDEIEKGYNACVPGKLGSMPTQQKAAHNLDCRFQDRREPHGSQFEEGYCSPYMTSGLKSAFWTAEVKHSSTPSKPWTEDAFATWDQEGCADSRVLLTRTKHTDGSIKNPGSASFISEKWPFFQQSSHSFSNVEFRSTTQDFSAHAPCYGLRGRPPDSSGDAVFPGENLTPDSKAECSEDTVEADYSKYQQAKVNVQREVVAGKNLEPIDSLHCRENSSKSEEAEQGTSDATSSVNVPDKSESDVDEKDKEVHTVRHQHDTEVSLPCKNEHEEIEREKLGGRKATTGMKRPSYFVDSSSQVMILQRYAFQLLCVQR